MSVKTVHAIVRGRVQGVFFRAYTRDEALKYGLAGWVRNLPDGSVEALIQGEADKVNRMVSWLYQGSPMSQVSDVIVDMQETVAMHGFDILY